MEDKTIQIPGWKIVRTIGQGGFGKVYEVEKDDEFGGVAHSALKVISIPESADALEQYREDGYDDAALTTLLHDRVEGLTAEFRLMSRLKGCSNIVSYEDHTVVRHKDDPGYDVLIRMELLTSLPKYLERHEGLRCSEVTVKKLGMDMCCALERCARHNIIHRDIKPQNIFINEEGDFKLGDFGVARQLEKTATFMSKKGTYNYMAPEVYKGEEYGATCDIYSLGLVMYRLLNNGRLPFLPSAPEPISPEDRESAIIRRMKGETLPAPKDGNEALKHIVLKACAFDPKDRYTNPTEMKRDLERLSFEIGAEEPHTETKQASTSFTEDENEKTFGIGNVCRPKPVSAEKSPFSAEEVEKTVGSFAQKPEAVIPPARKKAEKEPGSAPEAHREEIEQPTPKTQLIPKNKKLLLSILSLAVALVVAAVALIVMLSGKGQKEVRTAEQPTAKPAVSAVPTSTLTDEPTSTPETAGKPEHETTTEPSALDEKTAQLQEMIDENGDDIIVITVIVPANSIVTIYFPKQPDYTYTNSESKDVPHSVKIPVEFFYPDTLPEAGAVVFRPEITITSNDGSSYKVDCPTFTRTLPMAAEAKEESSNVNSYYTMPTSSMKKNAQKGYVNAESAQLRKGPGRDFETVRTDVEKGTEVTLYVQQDGWWFLKCGDDYGYIKSNYITKGAAPATAATGEKSGTVIVSKIALRKSADGKSECIKEYESGETVTIISSAKDSSGKTWYYVKTSDGKKGYMYAEYIKVNKK